MRIRKHLFLVGVPFPFTDSPLPLTKGDLTWKITRQYHPHEPEEVLAEARNATIGRRHSFIARVSNR